MSTCSKNEEEIKSCLYFTVSKLFRMMNKVAEKSFEDLNLCPTHAFLLILLEKERDGLTVNKISESLTIAPSTVTRFVDKLISMGYVKRIKNGKKSFTKITKKGLSEIPKIYESWNNIFNNVEKIVDDKEYLSNTADTIRKFTETFEKNVLELEE